MKCAVCGREHLRRYLGKHSTVTTVVCRSQQGELCRVCLLNAVRRLAIEAVQARAAERRRVREREARRVEEARLRALGQLSLPLVRAGGGALEGGLFDD